MDFPDRKIVLGKIILNFADFPVSSTYSAADFAKIVDYWTIGIIDKQFYFLKQ